MKQDMYQYVKRKFSISCLFLLILVSSCKKEKAPINIPLVPAENAPSSGIRLLNVTGTPAQITINNVPLTNQGVGTGTLLGTKYFPIGYFGDASNGGFNIPTTLLDKNENAHIIITFQQLANTVTNDTIIHNDPLTPIDYYLNFNNHFIKIKHSFELPSNPSNFKIRIVNFGAATDAFGLVGPYTLTFADGSIVNRALVNVAQNTASPYIEVPCGAYEFKLFANFNDKTKQLDNSGTGPNITCDPSGSGAYHLDPLQAPRFPAIQSFKPGATYDVLITQGYFTESPCAGAQDIMLIANAYRIITANSSPLNISYAVVQFVNALPTKSLDFFIDGNLISNNVRYTKSGNSTPIIFGTRLFEVKDSVGNILVQRNFPVYADDDITAWVYDKNGSPDLAFSSNDVTSSVYNTVMHVANGNKGLINDSVLSKMVPWQTRFLNLTNDIPYATFTNDLHLFGDNAILNPDSASINLIQGQPKMLNPNVMVLIGSGQKPETDSERGFRPNSVPFPIRAYASNPNSVPGGLLFNVSPLQSSDFVADSTTLYPSGLIPVPFGEPGIYTVALVGSLKINQGNPGYAQMIVVKHNR